MAQSPFDIPRRVAVACSHCRERKVKCLGESQQTSCIRCHFNGLSCEYLPTKRQQERSACPKNTRRTRTRRKASRQTSPVEQPGSSAPGVWSTSLDQAASVPIPPTTPIPMLRSLPTPTLHLRPIIAAPIAILFRKRHRQRPFGLTRNQYIPWITNAATGIAVVCAPLAVHVVFK
ncbi:hypothetical protein B0H13DRAFT_2463688 [Mycena leptocephala]|nr:hypothetical protein B0H13DRAFT_2463688 [Mycena leptocephala]